MSNKSSKNFKTSIGGQALIEGVMMRGPALSAMAVRDPQNEIQIETWDNPPTKWYHKAPFIRGVFNMISSMLLGYKTLMRSAEIAGQEEDMEPSKLEKWMAEKLGKDVMSVVAVMAGLVGVALAMLLFIVLPTFLGNLISPWTGDGIVRTLLEGLLKMAIFVGYLAVVSLMPDIHRVFQYHGAEHKTIACYEAGLDLTVENIKKQTRFHPRCGTSFLLIVLVVSILVFAVFSIGGGWIRVLAKILLMLPVVSISYEIIRLAGRFDNFFTRAISAPGMWLQRLTTKEPDDSIIEVAIASMLPVIPQEQGTDAW